MGTGPIVKLVLLLLVALSVMTWAIIIWKWQIIRRAERANREFLDMFWQAESLDHVYQNSERLKHAPVCAAFRAAFVELTKIQNKKKEVKTLSDLVTTDNITRTLSKAQDHENMRLEQFLGALGSVGSTGPFIGLFGTVWGIMNSFHGIAQSGSATLATVAPGISEALIATAIGLVAAIPSVLAYNYFLGRVKLVNYDIESFSRDFLNIVQRNIT